jgi:hypothetical protein
MMSLATDQYLIDLALATHYAGIQVDVGGTPTSVGVFVEIPSTEEIRERVFPSISILFTGLSEALGMYDSDDFEEEELLLNETPPVYSVTKREGPLPYYLRYSIHTWYKGRAHGGRDLLKAVVLARTKPRGYINAESIDGDPITLDMMWSGDLAVRNEELIDTVIYHTVTPVQIAAYLSAVEPDDTTDTDAAMEVRHVFKGYELLYSGQLVKSTVDLELKIDENGVERE